jgi:hypothetical protein
MCSYKPITLQAGHRSGDVRDGVGGEGVGGRVEVREVELPRGEVADVVGEDGEADLERLERVHVRLHDGVLLLGGEQVWVLLVAAGAVDDAGVVHGPVK